MATATATPTAKFDFSHGSFKPQPLSTVDLTLQFEHTILTILPASILIAIFPIALYENTRRAIIIVDRGWLSLAKTISALCLLSFEVTNLVLWTQQPSPYCSSLAIIASCLSCVAAGYIVAFLNVKRRHSTQPSSLLIIYLMVGLMLDIAKAKSYISRNIDLNTIATLPAATATIKGFIAVLEGLSNGDRPRSRQQCVDTEATGSVCNRSPFSRLSKRLFFGFHRILEFEDLEPLDPVFATAYLNNAFSSIWARSDKTSAFCLINTLLQSLSRTLFATVSARLCYTGFAFTQPFLLRRVVAHVNNKDPSTSQSYSLIGATFLLYLGMAISRAVYTSNTNRLVTFTRGILVSKVLQKSLTITYAEASKNSATGLISTDIDTFVSGLPILIDICIGFIEVTIGVCILTHVVGMSSFLALFPLVFTLSLGVYVTKQQNHIRKIWNDKIQQRLSQTIFMFRHIKSIKMLALDLPVSEYIQHLRINEINSSQPFRLFALILTTGAVFAGSMTPVIIVGGAMFWTKASERFTTEEAFTTIGIIFLVSWPILITMRCYPAFIPALACIQRIQEFLLLEDLKDDRSKLDPTYAINGRPRIFPNDIIFRANQLSIKARDNRLLIYNASFSLQRSTLTVVTGPVGSGKSMLLRALLGEISFGGTLEIGLPGNIIAYCDQKPWLFSRSLRDNIINEGPLDEDWYETVVNACLLDEDLYQLSEGEETFIGNDGMNLSGGQKKRVAMARALYSRAAIMIFDDILSGLDTATSNEILFNLFGDRGILRYLQTTVIMTSDSERYAAYADKILHIEDGHVVTINVFQASVPTDHNSLASPELDLEHDSGSNASSVASIDIPQDEVVSRKEKADKLAAEEAQEDFTLRRKGGAALYLFYFQSTKTWIVLVWVILLFLDGAAEIFTSIYFRIWLELAPENNLYFIGYVGVGCFSCLLCAAMFWVFYFYILPDSSNNLHMMLLKSTIRAKLSFLTDTDSEVILNKFNGDINSVSQNLPRAALMVIYYSTLISVSGIAILSGARYTASILPLVLLLLYAVQHYYLRTLRQMRFLEMEIKTLLYTHTSEVVDGLYHIRGYSIVNEVLQTGCDLLDDAQKPFYYTFYLQGWLTLVTDLIVLAVAITLVSFGVLLPQTTSQTAIGLGMVNLMFLGERLAGLVRHWTTLESSLGAIARVKAFVRNTPQESDTRDALTPYPGWPQLGHIVINNLTAAYSAIDVSQQVLQNISLEVCPGQTAVIFGRTGSGKTSLILSILNFLDYRGSIHVDGIDISKLPRHTLRSHITTITQETIELDGTVRYNMLPFKLKWHEGNNTLYDAEAVDVLCRLQLWERIASQGGLNTPMRDLELSSGQKQLLCIARAILHNKHTGSKVVLMDEPTSSLDLATDRYIQEEVFPEAFGHCAVLMVAHRLETIHDANVSSVIEMAEGRIVRVLRR